MEHQLRIGHGAHYCYTAKDGAELSFTAATATDGCRRMVFSSNREALALPVAGFNQLTPRYKIGTIASMA